VRVRAREEGVGGSGDPHGSTAPEPKQTTAKGLQIPVPKREDVLEALAKVAKPKPKPKPKKG
jgi:hypothetical protein